MSVTVTCPECGAKLKLKSRANLGKKRPCPKCEVPFVLSEEYNEPVYDLDARGAETKRLRCHGAYTQEGSFRVDDGLPNDFVAKVNVDRWSEVLNMLNAGEMPPEGEPRPSLVEATKVIEWIEHERLRAEIARNDRRVVLRRMNRREYNNTIRDLIGVTFNPGDQFPEDPPADGFDNNGGALTISPLHLELYLKAARQILDRAMPLEPTRKPIKWRFTMGPLHNVQGDAVWTHVQDQNGQSIRINAFSSSEVPNRNNMAVLDRPAWNRAAMLHHFHFPGDGEYIIRVRAAHRLPSRQQIIDVGVKHRGEHMRKHFETDRAYDYGPPRMKIRTTITHDVLDEFDVPAPENDPQVYETRAYFPRKRPQSVDGIRVESVYSVDSVNYNVEANKDWPYPELMIDWVELEGPFFDDGPKRRLLFDSPNRNNEQQYAREVLQRFMTKAYRRPVTDEEVQRRMALFQKVRPNKPNFEEAIKVPLMAVLSSPHFLYLVEPESFNAEPEATAESDSKAVASGSALNDYELASRLSYFLWSSMPDDELFQLAEQKRLTDPQVLASQVDRLLADQRSSAFGSNFSGKDYQNSISADQVAAKVHEKATRFPSLQLGVQSGTGESGTTRTLSFDRNGTPLPAENEPQNVFDRLFVPDDAKSRKATLQRYAERRSILDDLLGEAQALNRKLGPTDKRKLDEYLSSVRETEKRVQRLTNWVDVPRPQVETQGLQLLSDPNSAHD